MSFPKPKNSEALQSSQNMSYQDQDELSTALARQYLYDSIASNDLYNSQEPNVNKKHPSGLRDSSFIRESPRTAFSPESKQPQERNVNQTNINMPQERKVSDWYKSNVLFMRNDQRLSHGSIEDKDSYLKSKIESDNRRDNPVLINIKEVEPAMAKESYRNKGPATEKIEHINNPNTTRSGNWDEFEYQQYVNAPYDQSSDFEKHLPSKKMHFGILCFLLGFLLLPLWWVGAIYPRRSRSETESTWKRVNSLMSVYSIFFIVLIIVIAVLSAKNII
ncbi:hypothetical protein BB559_002850 [Furculomyces boomerangus]|uniref:Uncharacterized protein n=1 Tax=Furculomyces boomerangus TaxID=61424 RepID=A0A2T9YRN1_9FUNG|nr:hypothetical protein BB559_002850 [Furculomyces boomerangus]